MDGRGGPAAHGPQDAEADERRLLAAADVEAARARVRRAEAAKRAADAVTDPRIYRGHLYGGAAAQNAA